jgi:hypothetical protein
MAIIKQDDENEVKAPTVGAPSGLSAPTTPAKQASSGRFTNLQRYMSANQGNQLGQRVVGNINKAAEQTKQQLQTGQQEFAKQAGEAASAFQGGQGIQEKIKSGAEGLTADEIAKAQAMRDASYKGPQELGNIQTLKSGAQNIGQSAASTASEAGRQNLLKTMFAKQGYNTGQQRLDQLLLQGAQPTLNQARQTAGKLSREVGQADIGARTQAQNLAAEAAGVQKATRGAIEGAVTGLEQDLAGSVSAANAAREARYEKLRSALEKGTITDQDARALGLNLKVGENFLFDAAPETLLSKGATATAENVLSAQQAARVNALRQLGGGGYLDQFGAEAKAGSYDPSKNVVLDTKTLEKQIADRQSSLQSAADSYNRTAQDYAAFFATAKQQLRGAMPMSSDADVEAAARRVTDQTWGSKLQDARNNYSAIQGIMNQGRRLNVVETPANSVSSDVEDTSYKTSVRPRS